MTLVQNTPEWLEARKTMIGASDAPVILGVSPWTTPYQLWLQKLSLAEQKETEAMKRGKEKEEQARKAFEEKTGLLVFPTVKISPKHAWMMASFDGMDIEEKNIVEIKCPGKEDHSKAKEGVVPEKYIPQLQHQLFVCSLEKAFYFSYTEVSSVVLEVYRDDKFIEKMIQKEEAFYECMINFTSPELTDRDYAEREDEAWKKYAISYIENKKMLQDLETKEKALKQELIRLSEKKNCRGAGISLSRTMRKGSVDYSQISELNHINLDNYRKSPVEVWTIR